MHAFLLACGIFGGVIALGVAVGLAALWWYAKHFETG